MAIQNRTMFIESKRKSDGSKRFRVLPFFLVQDSGVGACFELASFSSLQRGVGDLGNIQDLSEELNKITHVEFITDEAQLSLDDAKGSNALHKYDVTVRDINGAPLAGLGVSP